MWLCNRFGDLAFVLFLIRVQTGSISIYKKCWKDFKSSDAFYSTILKAALKMQFGDDRLGLD